MVKFYSCSDKFLYRNGVQRFLMWVTIGVGGLLIINIFHKIIVGIENLILTLIWVAGTFGLLLYWNKRGGELLLIINSWIIGWWGEMIIKKKLKKLSDGYVFYDIKPKGQSGNIDFVFLNSNGIYVIEVKKISIFVKWSKTGKKIWSQTKNEVFQLRDVLKNNGYEHIWVQSLLILVNQKKYPIENDNNVHILGSNFIKKYFEDYTPRHVRKTLSDIDIENIAGILKKQFKH